jgi:hypothetical protein
MTKDHRKEERMTENKLAIYSQFDQIKAAAIALQQSGYFKDVTSQAQAIVKVMAGAELGLPPFASMSGIFIIQGKPVLGANILATLVKNDPRYNYQVKQCTHNICELVWFEDGKQVGTSTFTIEEAKTAGLTDKDNWRKFPSDMLFARAISRGARRFAPGIFGGSPVYTPDEMGVDTDVEGMIDVVATETVPPVVPPSNGDMTLEQAMAVTNSEGASYGDLSTELLANMTIGINKGLKKDISNEKQSEYLHKLDAIKMILNSRSVPVGA